MNKSSHTRLTHTLFTSLVLLAVLLSASLPQPGKAADPMPICVTIQPAATAGNDTYIKQGNVTENHGTDGELDISTESSKLMRSLLQFDLSSLPANASVTSADLSLWVKSVSGTVPAINAHQVTSSWNESQATWNSRDKAASLAWTTPGGDYNSAVLDAKAFANGGNNYWVSWNVAAAAQSWVIDPTTNFGIILESPATNPKSLTIFKSSDDSTASTHPKLEVCYNLLTPGLQIHKTLATPGPFSVGQELDYNITINNTGQTTVSFLPLEDWYDPTALGFLGATPSPDTASSGRLIWYDLTTNLGAFGPGQAVNVVVRFRAVRATTAALAALQPKIAANAIQPAGSAAPGLSALPAAVAPAAGTTLDSCGYPTLSSNPLTNIVFNESEVLRAFDPASGGTAYSGQTLKVWYNDEHALTLGVRQVQVKTSSGTTSTDYIITPLSTNPGSAINPLVGTTALSGDQAGTDISNRPMWPTLFITDITTDPNSHSGDWQSGGSALIPHAVFGTWKSAVRLVDTTRSPAVVTITPDIDPAKNNWNLGSGDPAPLGLTNQGYGAEARWNVDTLRSQGLLVGGHSYRFQFMVHDGDQNKAGGDVGEACTVISLASTGIIGDRVWYDANNDMLQQPGEPGINGVTVDLFGGVCPVSGDPTGTPLNKQVTVNDGIYHFNNLAAGPYCVAVEASTLPTGFVLTTANEPLTVNLATNQNYTDADFGYRANCTTGVPNYVKVSGAEDNYEQIIPDVMDAICTDITPASTIGDRVWLDENSDGYEDAGEAGLANATVKLYSSNGTTLVATTTTDTNGNYLFKVAPGTYKVQVDGTSLPAGLTQTTTYPNPGADYTNQDQSSKYSVTVTAGKSNLTADFGYNYSPTDCVTGNKCATAGAIGDRVWIDANGDGRQNPGEAGLAGVSVTLITPGPDGLFGTGDDVPTTQTTDAAGIYMFTSLPAGAYQVQVTAPGGYTQTGDPDQPNVTCTTCDNKTTTEIVLAPGDVYVNADFGYKPLKSYSLGNQVFLDVNGSGSFGGSDVGIAGVTVALLDSSGAKVIATTITNSNGLYSFPGLAKGTYTVWVNDTTNMLNTLVQSSTPNNSVDNGQACGACTGKNTVTLSGASNNNQDFGYAPTGQDSADVLIGDTIFLDANRDNAYTAGEPGIGGVTVWLYDSTGTNMLAATVTNANGLYYFGNYPAGTYVTKVDTTSLPAGLTNSVDPDGVKDSQSNTGALPAGAVKLDQDYGYKASGTTGTISGTIWHDSNADGALTNGTGGTPNETGNGIGSVTVALYADVNADGKLGTGEALLGTRTTNASGNYSFGGLPTTSGGLKYIVKVTDASKNLNGYWHSLGMNPGKDNNSQVDPYVVTLTSSIPSNSTADFGYYREITSVGDFVFYDLNGDGIQNTGEPGISGLVMTLTITWPGGAGTTVYSTKTDSNGLYIFGNLLSDEQLNGVGPGQPTFSISTSTPPSYLSSPVHAGSDPSKDAGNPAGETAAPTKNISDLNADFGFYQAEWSGLPDTFGFPKTILYPSTVDPASPDGYSIPQPVGTSPAVWLGAHVYPATSKTYVVSDPAADGVTLIDPSHWLEGAQGGKIQVVLSSSSSTSSGPAWLVVWFDWNDDGIFTGNEAAVNQDVSWTGSSTSTRTFTFDIPTGGIRTALNYRARLFDPPADPGTAFSGTYTNGEVEDYLAPVGTLPVTISYFQAQRQGNSVDFNWSTATETSNVGFNLYVRNGDQVKKVNSKLIASQGIDSLDQQDYKYNAQVKGSIYYIEEVSTRGDGTRFGPYELGESYGSQSTADEINWAVIQAEQSQKDNQLQDGLKQAMNDSIMKMKPSANAAAATSASTPTLPAKPVVYKPASLLLGNTFNMKVPTTGIYRVTYETLQSAGLDLAGTPASQITVLNGKWMVPDTVYTPDAGGKFGAGGYIEFYGEGLDTLYTDTNIYTLQVSNAAVPQIPVVNAAPGSGTASTSYTESLKVNRQRVYGQNDAPGNDPWYDTSMQTFTTSKSWNYSFLVNGLYNTTAAANLKLVVWGVTNWPQSPDHHLLVSLNGKPLADAKFDGWVEKTLDISVPGGVLKSGTNTLTLTLPGDMGVNWDLIDLDKYTLTYQHTYAAANGRLKFTASGNLFKVTSLTSANVEVYRLDANGQARLGQVKVAANGLTYTASFAGTGQAATYLVTTTGALYTPALMASGQPSSNLDQAAQYLVISHPSFISGLQPLVAARQAQGLTVNVVNVNDLYTKYTYGVFDPAAIQQYIAYAYQNLGTQYVLLVGGDTYDYRNYLGKNSLSFIPSLYGSTGLVRYVPADPLFADVNNDNVPELAIGRFPVRSTAELTLMVDKTLAYAGKAYGKTAVFAADYDGATSFRSFSDDLSKRLLGNWSVKNIYLENLSLYAAQSQLIAAMNAGTALVTYSGHSGPTSWGFNALFNNTKAQALTNVGKPFVVVQWGCWNTYVVNPTSNSLAQAFLFSGEQGAAAVLGSVTLSNTNSELQLGELLTPLMTRPGMTIGQALLTAKQQLEALQPGLLDVQFGWTLMGDPALVIQP